MKMRLTVHSVREDNLTLADFGEYEICKNVLLRRYYMIISHDEACIDEDGKSREGTKCLDLQTGKGCILPTFRREYVITDAEIRIYDLGR